MEYTPWDQIDPQLRGWLDQAVHHLKANGAADTDIADAVQRKLDAMEPIEEGE